MPDGTYTKHGRTQAKEDAPSSNALEREELVSKRYRKKIKGRHLVEFFMEIRQQGIPLQRLVFVCIGTDRSTGDAIGPLVGTLLEEAGYTGVVGTLNYPCDGSNLKERLNEIPPGKLIVAIDACLGQPASVEMYQVSNMPLEPGTSMGKALPAVGDYSIAAIVNVNGGSKFHILQTTSLRRVFCMAGEIVSAVKQVFPLIGSGV